MTFGEDWGWGASVGDSEDIITAYLEAGGNAIDTANTYTNGHSERIIGNFLARSPNIRDEIVLGTKFYCNLYPGNPNGGGAGRKAIFQQVENSLRRLQTEYVDLLWLHNWDRWTPLDETMRAMNDLLTDGKARYLGFSDTPAWIASTAQTLSEGRGWAPITAFQLEYSLLERTVEADHIPMTQHHGMGVMPWSPLKKGLLSGKYSRKGSTPHDSKRDAIAAAGGVADEQWRVIDELGAVATELGVSSAGVAINWVTRRSGVHSTLIGVRTLRQLQDNIDALALVLDPEHMRRLDDASAPRLGFPANYAAHAGSIQFAGTTVDGVAHPANPMLVLSPDRY